MSTPPEPSTASGPAGPAPFLHGCGPSLAGVVMILVLLVLAGHAHDDGVTLRPGGSDSVRLLAASGALFDRTILAPGEEKVACTPVSVSAEPGRYTFALQAVDVSGTLARNLHLDVDRVPAGPAAVCGAGTGVPVFRGTLAELGEAATQPWAAGDGDQLLRFRVRMGDGAGQGQTAAASFRFTLSALPVSAPDEPDERKAADPPASTPDGTPTEVGPTPRATTPTPQAADPTVRPTTPPTARPTTDPEVVAAPPAQREERPERRRDDTAPRPARDDRSGAFAKLVEAAPIALWPGLAMAGVPLFLLAQRQVDRGDPKLALAPLYDADLVVPLTEGECVVIERWCDTATTGRAVA